VWNCSSTLSYVFLACCLIPYRTFSSSHLHVSVYRKRLTVSSGVNPRKGICGTLSLYPSSEAMFSIWTMNPLNAELNLICYLLALLGAHHFLHVSRIRVKRGTIADFLSSARPPPLSITPRNIYVTCVMISCHSGIAL
jgi:hypothetical protein